MNRFGLGFFQDFPRSWAHSAERSLSLSLCGYKLACPAERRLPHRSLHWLPNAQTSKCPGQRPQCCEGSRATLSCKSQRQAGQSPQTRSPATYMHSSKGSLTRPPQKRTQEARAETQRAGLGIGPHGPEMGRKGLAGQRPCGAGRGRNGQCRCC